MSCKGVISANKEQTDKQGDRMITGCYFGYSGEEMPLRKGMFNNDHKKIKKQSTKNIRGKCILS